MRLLVIDLIIKQQSLGGDDRLRAKRYMIKNTR